MSTARSRRGRFNCQAEFRLRDLFQRQPKVTSFAVDHVWIGHHAWTNGKGATDVLPISGPGASHTLAAHDDDLVHNRMRPPGRGIRLECVAKSVLAGQQQRDTAGESSCV
jgi:hypothetical protein